VGKNFVCGAHSDDGSLPKKKHGWRLDAPGKVIRGCRRGRIAANGGHANKIRHLKRSRFLGHANTRLRFSRRRPPLSHHLTRQMESTFQIPGKSCPGRGSQRTFVAPTAPTTRGPQPSEYPPSTWTPNCLIAGHHSPKRGIFFPRRRYIRSARCRRSAKEIPARSETMRNPRTLYDGRATRDCRGRCRRGPATSRVMGSPLECDRLGRCPFNRCLGRAWYRKLGFADSIFANTLRCRRAARWDGTPGPTWKDLGARSPLPGVSQGLVVSLLVGRLVCQRRAAGPGRRITLVSGVATTLGGPHRIPLGAGRTASFQCRRLGLSCRADTHQDSFVREGAPATTISSARTRDDCAGEAYDKVAKLMGLDTWAARSSIVLLRAGRRQSVRAAGHALTHGRPANAAHLKAISTSASAVSRTRPCESSRGPRGQFRAPDR